MKKEKIDNIKSTMRHHSLKAVGFEKTLVLWMLKESPRLKRRGFLRLLDITKHISGDELRFVVNAIESEAINAIEDPLNPRQLRMVHKQEEITYPNLPWIVQDVLVTPVAMEICRLLGTNVVMPKRRYHFMDDSHEPLVYDSYPLIRRGPLNSPFNVQRLASSLMPSLEKAIEENDSKIVSEEQKLRGINLDKLVWTEIAGEIEEVTNMFLEQKYGSIVSCSYFDNSPIKAIGEAINYPDVLSSVRVQGASLVIGVKKEIKKSKEEIFRHKRENFSLNREGSNIIDAISEEAAESIKCLNIL